MILQKVTGFNFVLWVDGSRLLTLGNSYLNNILAVIVLGIAIFISKYTHKYIEVKGVKLGKTLGWGELNPEVHNNKVALAAK